MPRLSASGLVWCSGIAGAGFFGGLFDTAGRPRTTVSLAGAGGRAFLDGVEAVTQDFSRGEHDKRIVAINVLSGEARTLFAEGASEVDARGGAWASFYSTGVRTSTGLHLPHAYIGASTGPARNDCVGPDGQIAIKERYHSAGPWHVYRPDGSRWLLTDGDAANIQLLGGGRAIWRDGWSWRSLGAVPVPAPLGGIAWNLKMLNTPEGWWMVYQHDDGRVLAHPCGSDHGHVLAPAGSLAYGIDAVRLEDGRYRVLWATTEGEAPESLIAAHVRLTDARQSLIASPPPPPPPHDDEQEPSVPEIPNYFIHVEKVWATHGGSSHEAGAKVTRIVAYDLQHGLNGAPKDPRVGLYRKRSASTIQDRDPDKLCFDLGGGSIAFVDVIAAAGSPDAKPGWGEPHFEHDDDPSDFTSWVAPEPEPGVHTGGDDEDEGDIGTGNPVRPELADVLQHITDAASAALRAQRALADVEWPAPQEPHECPPCPLPHGDGLDLPDYEDAKAVFREIEAAAGGDLRRLGGDALGHLAFRYYARSHSREQVIEEARRRANGTWQEDW